MSGEIKFDPQTGEPVAPRQEVPQQNVPQQNIQQQAPAPKKGKGGKLAAGIIAAAAVVGGGIFGVNALRGGSPLQEVRTAYENTFVDDAFTEQIKAAGDMTKDGTCAIDMSLEASGQEVGLVFNTDNGKISADVDYNGIGGTVYVDDSKVTVDVDGLDEALFYDYTADKSDSDSYVVQGIGAETLEQIDGLLQMAQTMAAKPTDPEKVKDAVWEQCEALEFEELKEKSVDLGGETVSCGGYETTVTGEFLHGLMNAVCEETYDKSMDDMLDEISALGIDNGTADDIEAAFDKIDDIDLKIYINDEKLALVNVETEYEDSDIDVDITFAGEDVPWHEMTVTDVESGNEVTLKTEESDDVLVYKLQNPNGEEAAFEYGTGDGDFYLDVPSGEQVKGNFTVDNGEARIAVTEVSGQETNVDIALKDDAAVKDAPEGEDVLTMSQDDFSNIAMKLYSLYSNIG